MRRVEVNNILERFIKKVNKNTQSGCWEWIACLNTNGYGDFFSGSRKTGHKLAHRVSWEIHKGQIAPGLLVLHKCDNPKCVNPEHLFLGTHRDNALDAKTKGRLKGLIKPGQILRPRPYGFTEVDCHNCNKKFLKRHCRIRQTKANHYCSKQCFHHELRALASKTSRYAREKGFAIQGLKSTGQSK